MDTDQTSAMGSNYTDPAAGPQKARRVSAGAQAKDDRYYRMSAALPVELKDKFHGRMQELNLSSLGELVRLFTEAEGIVEMLQPLAREHLRREANRQHLATGQVSVSVLRQMSDEDLQHFITTVRSGSGDN